MSASSIALSEEQPAGPDLRQSDPSPVTQIKDARFNVRSAEREASSAPPHRLDELKAEIPEQWRAILGLTTEALQQTRDLEIGAWHVEALLRCEGLPGFTRGVQFLAEMVEQLWDRVHSMRHAQTGVIDRLAPLAALSGAGAEGALAQPIRDLVLFEWADGQPYSYAQYLQTLDLAKVADPVKRQQRIDRGTFPLDTVEAAASTTGSRQLAALRQHASAALDAWQRLSGALEEHAGPGKVPTTRLRDMLQDLVNIGARYGAPAPVTAEPAAPPAAPTPGAQPEDPPVTSHTSPALPASGLRHREDALRALEMVAAFFQQTEPHSPLSYTLQEAIRRGRMNWLELLSDIVPDASTRGSILTSLGIKPPAEEP